MSVLQEQNVFDKKFVRRVAMMIESGLIDYRHYQPWADEIITALEKPPYWILEISTVQYGPLAVQIANNFVFSEPLETLDSVDYVDEYLGCLFLRYSRGEITWAAFLLSCGKLTDGRNRRMNRQNFYNSDDFYHYLNILEESEFSKFIEQSQRAVFELEYSEAIASVQPLYQGFLEYFRRKRA